MKFSASLLKRWMTCPLQVRFKDILDYPEKQGAKTVFGTCTHDALQIYNETGNVDLAEKRWLQTWENPLVLGQTIDYWHPRSDYKTYLDKGLEIIRNYHAEVSMDQSREVIAAEHKFCVPFGEHTFSGIVDLVEWRKYRNRWALKIVDYKTSSKKPTAMQLRLDVQFTAYQYASEQKEFWTGFDNDPRYPALPNGEELYERFLGKRREAIWYHLWTSQEMSAGERDELDYMRLYRVCEEIENAINKDVFVPNISGDTCMYCSYSTEVCPVVIPIAHKFDKEIE